MPCKSNLITKSKSPHISVTVGLPFGLSGRKSTPSENCHAPQSALCRDIYDEFLRDLVIASRRHKDELLTAMLELLLSAPRALLRPAVSASWDGSAQHLQLVPVLRIASHSTT